MLVEEDSISLFFYCVSLIDANNYQVKSAPDHKQLMGYSFQPSTVSLIETINR